MSEFFLGAYFSCNADKSAHDYTTYIEVHGDTAKLAPRYKNAESNSLYEMEFDADDLQKFGEILIDISKRMR